MAFGVIPTPILDMDSAKVVLLRFAKHIDVEGHLLCHAFVFRLLILPHTCLQFMDVIVAFIVQEKSVNESVEVNHDFLSIDV
jgi:hypothetical protein